MGRITWVSALFNVVSLCFLTTVHAHGPAKFIMDDPETGWCCGHEDCEAVAGKVAYSPAGYTVKGLRGAKEPGQDGFYYRDTPDGGPWACRVLITNQLRCLIMPRTGL